MSIRQNKCSTDESTYEIGFWREERDTCNYKQGHLHTRSDWCCCRCEVLAKVQLKDSRLDNRETALNTTRSALR